MGVSLQMAGVTHTLVPQAARMRAVCAARDSRHATP
jgi:hypothetical protein